MSAEECALLLSLSLFPWMTCSFLFLTSVLPEISDLARSMWAIKSFVHFIRPLATYLVLVNYYVNGYIGVPPILEEVYGRRCKSDTKTKSILQTGKQSVRKCIFMCCKNQNSKDWEGVSILHLFTLWIEMKEIAFRNITWQYTLVLAITNKLCCQSSSLEDSIHQYKSGILLVEISGPPWSSSRTGLFSLHRPVMRRCNAA